MNRTYLRGLFLASMIACSSLTLAGCSSGLEGTYESAEGDMSVEFKSGKAYLTMNSFVSSTTVETEYEVNGDKVILTNDQENLVLTRNDDGTLSGPMGPMKKKES